MIPSVGRRARARPTAPSWLQLIAHAQGGDAPGAIIGRISDSGTGVVRIVPSTSERASAEPHGSAAVAPPPPPRAHTTPPVMVAPGSSVFPMPMRHAPSDGSSLSTSTTAAPRQSSGGRAGGSSLEWGDNPEGWDAYSAIISQSEDMVRTCHP